MKLLAILIGVRTQGILQELQEI